MGTPQNGNTGFVEDARQVPLLELSSESGSHFFSTDLYLLHACEADGMMDPGQTAK